MKRLVVFLVVVVLGLWLARDIYLTGLEGSHQAAERAEVRR